MACGLLCHVLVMELKKPSLKRALNAMCLSWILCAACAPAANHFEEANEGQTVIERGRVIRRIRDDFREGHLGTVTEHVLEREDGIRIPLDVDFAHLRDLPRAVVLEGVRQGNALAVTEVLEAESPAPAPQPILKADGVRKAAILLFNFQKDTREPFTAEEVRSVLFGEPSVTSYFRDQSFGMLRIEGRDGPQAEAYGYYTIAADPAKCDPDTWQRQAVAAAKNAGVNLSGYDHIIMYFPQVKACAWAGLAEAPGRLVWIQGDAMRSSAVAHELGHNYGLQHANVLRCKDAAGKPSAALGTCKQADYADHFDVMSADGYLPPHHTNARNKAFLGWFAAEDIARVHESAEIKLLPLEDDKPGVHAIAIPRLDGSQYWIDLRTTLRKGTPEANKAILKGVMVHLAEDVNSFDTTALIDTVPETETINDAAITLNRPYVDAENNVTITLAALQDGIATVRVQIGDTPVPTPVSEASPEPEAPAPEAGPAPSTPDPGLSSAGDDDAGVTESADAPFEDPELASEGVLDTQTNSAEGSVKAPASPIRGSMGCQLTRRHAGGGASSAWLSLISVLFFTLRRRLGIRLR